MVALRISIILPHEWIPSAHGIILLSDSIRASLTRPMEKGQTETDCGWRTNGDHRLLRGGAACGATRAQHAHGSDSATAHSDDDGATAAAATAADSATAKAVKPRKRQLALGGFSKRKRVAPPTSTNPHQVTQEADADTAIDD